jgi:hypothetical protein
VLTRVRQIIVPAVAVAVFAALAACSEGGSAGPRALPVIQRSPDPSASRGRPATPTPSSRNGSELAAATAVVRRYYRVTNALARHMDPSRLAALFTADCQCQAQVRAVRHAAADREHYIDHADLHAVRGSIEDSSHAYVLVDLSTSRGGLVRADGTPVSSTAPRRHLERVFRLERVGRSWRIYRIEAA